MQKTALFSKRFIVLILLCLETTFVSCKNKITKIELINKNPIEYIFKSSKDSLYKLITSQFNLKDLSLLTIERSPLRRFKIN